MSHSCFFFFLIFLTSGLRRKPLDIVWWLWRRESRPCPKQPDLGEKSISGQYSLVYVEIGFPSARWLSSPARWWSETEWIFVEFYFIFFFLDKCHHHMSRTGSLSSFHWELRVSSLFSFYVWPYSSSAISIMIASDPSIPNSLGENAPSHKLDFGNYLNIAIFLLFCFPPQRFMLSSACRKHSLIVGFLFSQNLISQSANCPHRYF